MSQAPETMPLERFRAFLREVQLISTQTEATDVAMTVISETCKVLNADRCSFFFVDGEFLDLVIAKGADNIRLPISTGFAGACATSGKIVNIPDAYQDDRFNQSFDKKSGYRTKQILVVPVKDPDGSIVGVLQAINKKDGDTPFDTVDEELMVSIAGQVGVSIRYSYQLEEARQATDQKNALMAYIKSMSGVTTAATVLFSLYRASSELLEADRCTFFIVDHNNSTVSVASTDSSVDIILPLGKGIAGECAATGKMSNIRDVYEDDRFDSSWDKQTNYRTKSMLVMPVFPEAAIADKSAERKPLAVVQLINKKSDPDYFSQDDEDLLAVLLRFISPILSHSNLFVKKSKQKEATRLKDLNVKQIQRQPSQDMLPTMQEIVIEEGDEDDSDEDL